MIQLTSAWLHFSVLFLYFFSSLLSPALGVRLCFLFDLIGKCFSKIMLIQLQGIQFWIKHQMFTKHLGKNYPNDGGKWDARVVYAHRMCVSYACSYRVRFVCAYVHFSQINDNFMSDGAHYFLCTLLHMIDRARVRECTRGNEIDVNVVFIDKIKQTDCEQCKYSWAHRHRSGAPK